jgi:NCS1 family nucleobase:cation symporter-1
MSKSQSSTSIVNKLDMMYEFDREPITENRLHGGRYFAGLFAGEHVAATEFVIGALFVSWGATAVDIIFGLILGNLLAVLSWTFITTPIAIKTRLTLYWYLRKIAGPYVMVIYNILNAVLYCILAGAMITVSASAVRIPFNIPSQTQWYPEDFRFVLVVLIVGAVVVTLAILGFKRLAQFSTVCSPWMFLMFIAGALATLPALAASVPSIGSIASVSDLWVLAKKAIWTGASLGQNSTIGFWHVAAFAWICNLAMHIGLSDMAIFRYAKRVSYGLYSSFGMFLGHYLAWIAAGIMGAAAAAAMKTSLLNLDSGGIAFHALGVSGAIAVVIAGWTTSNPTLYRAGLALQVVTPGWPRWSVTLIAGVITTLVACFPFVFTKLLDFVGIYGLLLAPMGAIVVVEHWIFPKIGFTQYWSSLKNNLLNWPALISWTVAILVAFALWKSETLHLFFLLIPVWILTAILYILLSAIAGAREKYSVSENELKNAQSNQEKDPATQTYSEGEKSGEDIPNKRSLLTIISGIIALIALLFCFIIPFRVFLFGIDGYADHVASMKTVLTWLMILYFISGTYYLSLREKKSR